MENGPQTPPKFVQKEGEVILLDDTHDDADFSGSSYANSMSIDRQDANIDRHDGHSDPTVDVHAGPLSTDLTQTTPRGKRVSIDTHDSVDRHTPAKQPRSDVSLEVPSGFSPKPPVQFKVPYPTAPKKSRKELEDDYCRHILSKVKLELPLLETIETSPPFKKFIKRVIFNNCSLEQGIYAVTKGALCG